MKLHTNPKTGMAMTANMNSEQMPQFLQSSHGQLFEFVQRAKTGSQRKHLLPSRSATIRGIIIQNAKNGSDINHQSSTLKESHPSSFQSCTMKLLMKDSIPNNEQMSKSFINNRIFHTRKEYAVPQDQCVRQKTSESFSQTVNLKESYFKPGQFSKLACHLGRSKILMRERQPQSPRNHSRFGSFMNRRSQSRCSKFGLSKTFSQSNNSIERTSTTQKTLYDYQRLYEKHQDLDSQSLQNTRNHLLAFEQILHHVDKNRSFVAKKLKKKSNWRIKE